MACCASSTLVSTLQPCPSLFPSFLCKFCFLHKFLDNVDALLAPPDQRGPMLAPPTSSSSLSITLSRSPCPPKKILLPVSQSRRCHRHVKFTRFRRALRGAGCGRRVFSHYILTISRQFPVILILIHSRYTCCFTFASSQILFVSLLPLGPTAQVHCATLDPEKL
jgi:hypothetical protein